MKIAWEGTNRTGGHCIGRCDVDPCEFTEAKFKARWRELSVTPAAGGDEVGGIGSHPDSGRRVWWADPNADLIAGGQR